MRAVRIGNLQAAVGAFLTAMGALMLVAPHQFSAATYTALRPHLLWWGVFFLLGGGALLATGALAPGKSAAAVVHLLVGVMLLLLARGFAAAGAWAGASVYTVLGVGTALGGLFARSARGTAEAGGGGAADTLDLFALVMGVSATGNGLLILALPQQFSASIYDPARLHLPWYGAAFLAGGLALTAAHAYRALPRGVHRAAHLLAAAAFFAWLLAVQAPNRNWTGIAYYGGFGTTLAVLPWLGPRLRRIDWSSLRARLGLALAAAAALPLIVAVTLITNQEQRAATEQALALQRTLAGALAQDVADYVGLHGAAAAALAAQPGLMDLAPDAQRSLLRRVATAYPSVVAFATFDADANPVARGDDRPLFSLAGVPLFEEARRTNSPTLDIRVGAFVQRPTLLVGAPVRGADGQFAGLALGLVETTQLARLLARASAGAGVVTYLVDDRGRAIAHPDASLVAALADLSSAPPVAAMLGGGDSSGALRYEARGGEWLAGYTRVPEFGWGVVVERSSAAALASAWRSRDVAFAIVILVVGVATAIGALAAGWLVAPLRVLARAAEALAAGEPSAPLPQSGTTEVGRLAAVFGQMRDRLAARTAERERALRLRDDVLAAVSHDLRNPLTTIRLQTHVLLDEVGEIGTADGTRWVEDLARVDAATTKMERLIDELLDVARLQMGQRLYLNQRPTDLVALARQVAADHQQTTEQHQIHVEAAVAELTGIWDPVRLERVLANLLANAIKYSPGGGTITIELAREAADTGAAGVLVVRDHGVGIPAADLPHVFERFHRAGNVAGQIGGSGIGLASARQIVEQHRGTITVDSEEGKGATFTVRLPLETPEDEDGAGADWSGVATAAAGAPSAHPVGTTDRAQVRPS